MLKKITPLPIEEVGFPDIGLYLIKYSFGFPGFLNKNPYFHTNFPKKFTLLCFLTLNFRENFARSKWNSRLFTYVELTSSNGGGQNLSGIAHCVNTVWRV